MKKFLLMAVAIAAIAGSACSKAPECTTEVMTKKAQELTTALQEAITKDPSKAAELTGKVTELTAKYSSSTQSGDACKAYDELIKSVKS